MRVQPLIYVSLFATIMGVLGIVPPIFLGFTPVPITLQSFGVMLSGSLLGTRFSPKYAALSQIVFLLVVAAGLPLLSGGRGGVGVFVSPSGGYLIGYVIGAYVIGHLFYRMKSLSFLKVLVAYLFGGMIVIYLFGIPFQAFMMDIAIDHAMVLSIAYLPGDLLKVIVASLLTTKLLKMTPFSRRPASE